MFFTKYKRSPAVFEVGFGFENQPRPGLRRSEMPELFHIMFAGWPQDLIVNQESAGLLELDPAAMRESMKPAFRFEKIPRGSGLPIEDGDLGELGPTESPGGGGLIETIHANGIVRAGSTEPIAPFRFADVSVRSGVDEDLLISRAKDEAEGVGVAVAGWAKPETARSHDHLRPAASHARDAGFRE